MERFLYVKTGREIGNFDRDPARELEYFVGRTSMAILN